MTIPFRIHRIAFGLIFLSACLLWEGTIQAGSLHFPRSTYGICLGNAPRFTGVRVNFSDREVVQVNGVNITLWRARENTRAVVNGLSVGLYGPEAGVLRGIHVGLISVAGTHRVHGLSLSAIGIGSGGTIRGMSVAGIGVGADSLVRGIALGGIGVGSGGSLLGIMLGGIGVGAMDDVQGIALGGLGVGAGENIRGLSAGLLGVGAGENLSGIAIGGIGVGAGNNLHGAFVGGVGVGCRGELTGVGIAGLAVAAGGIRGAAVSLIANGAYQLKGGMATLLYNRIRTGGVAQGVLVGSYNRVSGKMVGLSLGLVNEAQHLHGVQIGLINIVHQNPGIAKVFPLFNFGK